MTVAKFWDGSQWVSIQGMSGPPGAIAVYEQPDEPVVNAPIGSIWIDTDAPSLVGRRWRAEGDKSGDGSTTGLTHTTSKSPVITVAGPGTFRVVGNIACATNLGGRADFYIQLDGATVSTYGRRTFQAYQSGITYGSLHLEDEFTFADSNNHTFRLGYFNAAGGSSVAYLINTTTYWPILLVEQVG